MIEKEIPITSFDVFPNSTVKPSALLRYMQQAAREDCDSMGCTSPFMREQNTVFVLTRLGLKLFRPVTDREVLTLKTFNNSINGLFFDREYEFFSNGEKVAHCSSFWVLIRFDTRRLVRPKDFPVQFESLGLPADVIDIPRSFDSEGIEFTEDRLVRVSDLDENNHLNNCIYADICTDALSHFDGLSQTIEEMKIIFRHEARLGDILSLSLKTDGTEAVIFAENDTTEEPCFEAMFRFRDIDA